MPQPHKYFADDAPAQGRWAQFRRFCHRHPIIANIGAACLVILLSLCAVMVFLDFWTHHGETTKVPDVRNLNYVRAAEVLAAHGLDVEINDSIYDSQQSPGTVLEVFPKPGAVVKDGRQVYVTVVAFSPRQLTISMPLAGSVSSRQAMSYLKGLGIKDIRVRTVVSDYPELVVGAYYGDTPIGVGSVLPANATVTLEVGTAPAPSEIPADSLETISTEPQPAEPDYYD